MIVHLRPTLIPSYAISADARYVAFASWSKELTTDTVSGYSNVFLFARDTGTITLVFRPADGQWHGNDGGAHDPAISGDGSADSCLSIRHELPDAERHG